MSEMSRRRFWIRSVLRSGAVAVAVTLLFATAPLGAQRAVPPGTGDTFKNTYLLKPPAGTKVAIIELEDLECPACAASFPIVHQAAAHYKIPLVRKDFPLGGSHIWSLDAAIWARYLQDKVSPEAANFYRGDVFKAQRGIASKEDMLSFTRKFFVSHKLNLPFVVDPTGQFRKEVEEDRAFGDKLGLNHTPTIIVCSQKEWVQVTDVYQLYQTIDAVMARAR